MKVVVVTGFTPTPENTRGISGLLYAMLRYRPKNVEVKIFTFNINKIEDGDIKEISRSLSSDIVTFQAPRWTRLFNNVWMGRFNKFCMKRSLDYYVITKEHLRQIRNEKADWVWIYPYFYYRLAKLMPDQKCVVTGCDCEALIQTRALGTKHVLRSSKVLRHHYLRLKRGLRFESEWNQPNLKVHFVGEEDKNFYERIYGYRNAFFIRHPHYSLMDKEINFSKPKLKVIMTGGYDIYTEDDVDLMLPNLIKHNQELHEHFEFTILGKTWEPVKRKLEEIGFECQYKTWVDDYAEELIQHDIQLAPISYGTGTKGKVLSALANGLLVVGSKYALENIVVKNNESCVQYQNASDVAEILLSIAQTKSTYEQMAKEGREQVRRYHHPEVVSKQFFEIYGK